MLVEFRIKNFRSFQDEQVLSLVASNDPTLEENCATEGKLRLLKAAGIYGSNASGKSNLVKAISVMQDLVLNSADFKPGSKLPIKPFLLDDKSQAKPSFFEVTFFHKSIRYQYGFTATDERIHEEWLLAYPKGQPQRWYERNFNKLSTLWSFGPSLKGEKAKISDKTRDNALFLSVAAQWNNEQLSNVYEWFNEQLKVVKSDDVWMPVTAKILVEFQKDKATGQNIHSWIAELLQSADMGIHGIKVKAIEKEKVRFPENLPASLKEQILKELETKPIFDVKTLHRNEDTGRDIYFPMKEESAGTQRFFNLLGPFLETITYSFTAFIDELETSLHPLLTRELVKFVQSYGIGDGTPQLIFTTHDTTLLDPELFRRDQIWFTEKDKVAATHLYSMSDYKERKPRKGEAMQKGYLAGRYGAIPILEAFRIPNG